MTLWNSSASRVKDLAAEGGSGKKYAEILREYTGKALKAKSKSSDVSGAFCLSQLQLHSAGGLASESLTAKAEA